MTKIGTIPTYAYLRIQNQSADDKYLALESPSPPDLEIRFPVAPAAVHYIKKECETNSINANRRR